VNYIADAAGFRAAITSNEPGVESKNTAGTLYNQGEVPPGPVIDETLLVAPAVHAGRLVAAPGHLHAAPAQVLAAPAPVAAVAHAPLVAHAPAHFTTQVAHAHAAPLATQAAAPFNHGPFFGAAGISAPVLNAPGVNVFGQLTNAAVPTVNSNPLTDGPFARFARPAISTPAGLATGPLASPLSPFQSTPLASPQVAASGQLLSAPVPAGPLAPGVAAVAAAPVAHAPLFHHHQQQLLAQQQLIASGRLVAAPGQLVHGHHQQLLAPAAPVAVAAHHAHPAAGIAGVAFQTQINHALAPAAHAHAAPLHVDQVAQVRY